ncbi:Protein of unknown function [Butyrivibrio fibrisolvens DSM 3071]|uniref:SMODS and SLOG-associating 2TM effector domain-containing protein n=1 Tax=Butyrivibrio fibrisolvens DSM 3071 TaxID=1121131 RepID=A0A1M5ZT85_BUTFI|nr:DUF4231 domain-containing protein [Butyrivibrio fibrisolvens]SHI27329.1 Protein of unknown function [Butyrivibrio fibrisolvens DSM 3071]
MSDNTNKSSSENQKTMELRELVKLPENEQYLFLLNSVPNDEERIRIGLVLDYYIKNANKNRKYHRWFSALGVIIPALATFVSVFSGAENFPWFSRYMVPFMTAITSIVVGISSTLKFTDKHRTYRNCAESIKHILLGYACGQGDFADMDKEEKETLLYDQTEKIIQEGSKELGKIDKGLVSRDEVS